MKNDGKMVTETVELWLRDPVECVRELFSNPTFKEDIKYGPQKVYTDESRTERIYNEMWTGKWWWKMQVSWSESIRGENVHLPRC
jgi:hypothetical protein